MKNLYSLLFIFLFSALTFAQKTVSGVVKNSDGETIASASVTVEEPGKDAIIAYGISNSKGEFKVTFTSDAPTVDVKVKAFNHKPTLKNIKNESQNLNFSLSTEATEIKEVKIKAKMITKKGDTISYDVKAFEGKNDRVLADVLKKIPGIEVNKDGTVLYQGEAINKFYVNGKDLMEGGYGVINNSLPTDAISKVEVMENHQPVKILQDKVPSEQAAINIKLKNKVTMTGRGEVGVGIADPWLWNMKLTPMFFGQKNQWVVNYKTNNNGEAVEAEGNMLAFGNRWEGRRRSVSQDAWVNVENAAVPSVPERRYLWNNVHFISANLLTNPFSNKEWELKANANYTNNAVERDAYSETYDKQRGLTYITDINNHFYTNKAKGELIFTKNAKKGFFKNTTTFTQFWNADRAKVLRNGISATEAVESPTQSYQNSLSAIVPWKEKMVNVQSYLSYQNDHQILEVRPVAYLAFPVDFGNADLVRQDFRMKAFEARHSANISFTKNLWTITPEVGLDYESSKLTSGLFGVTDNVENGLGKSFANDLDFSSTMPYASLGVNYKSEDWLLFLNLPANFYNIKADDAERGVHRDFSKFAFEPNLFAQYSFASFWKANFHASYDQEFGGISNVYAGALMSNPSSLGGAMLPTNPMLESQSMLFGTKIEYRNPLNNLFFNVGANYNRGRSNIIANSVLGGTGLAVVTYETLQNGRSTTTENAEVGKYFPKFKSNMSVSFRNTDSRADQFRNNQFFQNQTNAQSLGYKFNNTYFSWMSMDYTFSLGRNTNKSILGSSKSGSFQHNLSVIFYPIESHSIGLNWDQMNYTQNDASYKNAFYDLTYQYTWTKKKMDFELKWMNIANQKYYERLTDNAASTTLLRSRIRPSTVMFTVKFNFK